ncbi:immunoglobulin superfamily member 6 [Spinachia spinachia]
MRSFTNGQASDMDRLVWFSLLLSYLPVTVSMKKSCVPLQTKRMVQQTGTNAVLKCAIESHCFNELHYEWFIFNARTHAHLNLSSDSQKYSLEGTSLKIKSLLVNDSGIYHCAVESSGDPAPGAQHVALGTTLVVREHNKIMIRYFLWASFALLAIYSLALVTLIIKKYGRKNISRSKSKTKKKNSTKNAQFRDVLQEMYSRRNLDKGQKDVSRNRSHAEAANTEVDNSNEDIYQNV